MRLIRIFCDACLLLLFVTLRCMARVMLGFLGLFAVGSRKSDPRTRR